MSIIKSLSVGEGDMFYIQHNTDSFTIIDCCLTDDNKKRIVDEIVRESSSKSISRFISTHPDEDHFGGIEYLDSKKEILNFYCVKNEVTKTEETSDFTKYCELRDSSKAFFLQKGSTRKWLNQDDDTRHAAGITILWPITSNEYYMQAFEDAKQGESPNDISTIIRYAVIDSVTVLWMGDLGTDFMENIKDDLDLPKVNVLFAPHHGRDSGTVPSELLEEMNPDIIVIGEADSEHLNYYDGYNTITQNSAGDITFDCDGKKVHVYVSSDTYSVDFLDDEGMTERDFYIGTLNI
ncbi:MAG: hypothetical protein ABSA44_08085 [Bacteroidota bacterium]|jgi:beta-lactamase superfamily II metal-dependent hydrolase